MKSYEEFSPEAKQAIEQFRKFTSGLKSDQVESYDSGRPYWFIEDLHFNNHKSFEKIMYYGCHMFGVSYDEAKDLAKFAESKNYWISKEVITNTK